MYSKIKINKSNNLWKRAIKIIPTGAQTASKAPDQFAEGVYPKYIERGQGAHVFDVDGNEYIDYPCALGVNFLGWNYPAVVNAVIKQAKKGFNFSLMSPLEVEVAELLIKHIPSAESVRFLKSGADACSGSVRIAKSYTKRNKIVACGYHGWHDWYIISSPKNSGISKSLKKDIIKFNYNDLEHLNEIFKKNGDKIAAVIMEPLILDDPVCKCNDSKCKGPKTCQNHFLHEVKKIAHKNGALLIFDEIVTGFRFGLGGIQSLYNITPDLTCLNKALANGLPLSAIVGNKKIMKECEKIFMSLTFGGETLSLAAAKAVIQEMEKKDVLKKIWSNGKILQTGFKKAIYKNNVNVKSVGQAPRQNLIFMDDGNYSALEIKTFFLQETIKRGILIGNTILINYSHSVKDINKTIKVVNEVFKITKLAILNKTLITKTKSLTKKEVFRQSQEKKTKNEKK